MNDKINPRVTLFKKLLLFCTIRQGPAETNDDYMARFLARVESLELAHRRHILTSLDILAKKKNTIPVVPTVPPTVKVEASWGGATNSLGDKDDDDDDRQGSVSSIYSKEEIKNKEQHFLAVVFLLRADFNRYRSLWEDNDKSTNCGRDEYPKPITAAFDMLVTHSQTYRPVNGNPTTRKDGGGR